MICLACPFALFWAVGPSRKRGGLASTLVRVGQTPAARALTNLPSPTVPEGPEPAALNAKSTKKVVAPGHRGNGSKGQNGTPPVTAAGGKGTPQKRLNPRLSKGLGNESQSESSADADDEKWRRRESKERLRRHKQLQSSRLQRSSQACLHYVCTVKARPVTN